MSDPACFVGIDVAKATLDCAVVPTGQTWQLSNADVAFPDLVARPRTFAPERSVFEATGGFEHGVVAALAAAGLPVVVANPRQVRDFGRACGQLAKSDRIDAAGASHHLPFSPSRQAITSSSPRTASSTVMTGRASKTKAGSIEQNL